MTSRTPRRSLRRLRGVCGRCRATGGCAAGQSCAVAGSLGLVSAVAPVRGRRAGTRSRDTTSTTPSTLCTRRSAAAAVLRRSTVPARSTIPSVTVTSICVGSAPSRSKTSLSTFWRMSSSLRTNALSRSPRLTTPTRPPWSSMTGSRLTAWSDISRAACARLARGPMVTGWADISSLAVSPRRGGRPCPRRGGFPPVRGPGDLVGCLRITSASETTPISWSSSSSTGRALMWCSSMIRVSSFTGMAARAVSTVGS